MKYLLVIVVVWIAFMIWRSNRRREVDHREAPSPPPGGGGRSLEAPQAMLRCAHCGLHLPATDALPGPDGKFYCSAAHRQADR